MPIFPKFIDHVPMEVKPSNDGIGVTLTAAGVRVWFHGVGPLPDKLFWEIEDALEAKAAAEGVNMPVALASNVWALRCRRCKAPFIDLPHAKMCSDACRAEAKRDGVRRASAKRAKRRAKASNARTSMCRHCGECLPARRSTKRFCSVRCRVAAHRGASATFVVEWPDIGETPEAAWVAWAASTTAALDRQIADMQSVLGGLKEVGTIADKATMLGLMQRIMALQAERRALATPAAEPP